MLEPATSTTATHVVRPGDIVEGRYRIRQQLADGGMGTVFLAEHVLIKRRVAIKVLHAELAHDMAMVRRFMNEALAAGTLGHPNIVESTDMGFTKSGVPFIVFEYLEGCLLTEEVYRLRGLPVRRALRMAIQIASALEAAHNANIVHLDLKSDNIFLTDKDGSSDHAKVLDFGISKFMELDGERTQRGMLMGTPEYMAPEQVSMPDHVDKRADIYALGVVLYEMLAARRPFEGSDPRILLHRIVNETPPPINRADVPPELDTFIMKRLLAKARDERVQTMSDVLTELDDISQRVRQESASGSIPPTPMPMPTAMGSAQLPVAAQIITLEAPRTRFRGGWFLFALLAGGAAVGAHVMNERTVAAPLANAEAALQIDAEKIAASLSDEARAARLRLQGLATSPMLRAAVVTDAATVHDMVTTESLFKRADHEVLELLQQRGDSLASLVRLPEGAAAIPAVATAGAMATAHSVHFTVGPNGSVLVSAAEPVVAQDGTPAGVLAMATPVDLTFARSLIAEDAVLARLDGLGAPVELVAGVTGTSPGERTVTVPVPVDPSLGAGALTLSATVRDPAPAETFPFLKARMIAVGASGLFLFAFLISSLLVRRDRRLVEAL